MRRTRRLQRQPLPRWTGRTKLRNGILHRRGIHAPDWGFPEVRISDGWCSRIWLAHTDLDERHYAGIKMAAEPHTSEREGYELVREGAISAAELELQFWEGLQSILW